MMAAGTFATLLKLKNKHVDKLGFVSLGGTLIKFVIFFLVFDPLFEEDGETTKKRIRDFLYPLCVCYISLETVFLVRILNKKQTRHIN